MRQCSLTARPDADPVAVAARMRYTHSAAVSGCSPSCARRSGQDEGVAVITAVLGDITKQTVDAIVNAADEAMRGGGGGGGALPPRPGPANMSV